MSVKWPASTAACSPEQKRNRKSTTVARTEPAENEENPPFPSFDEGVTWLFFLIIIVACVYLGASLKNLNKYTESYNYGNEKATSAYSAPAKDKIPQQSRKAYNWRRRRN